MRYDCLGRHCFKQSPDSPADPCISTRSALQNDSPQSKPTVFWIPCTPDRSLLVGFWVVFVFGQDLMEEGLPAKVLADAVFVAMKAHRWTRVAIVCVKRLGG